MPPGEMGADIVVGEGQSIGIGAQSSAGPMSACSRAARNIVRQMPGRLAGETVDAEGKRGFVLTLSTREQHIRREKATSNICTNSGLCALAFTIHMTLLGEKGLRAAGAAQSRQGARAGRAARRSPGRDVLNATFFNEFTLRVRGDAAEVVETLAREGVLGGVPLAALSATRSCAIS